MANRYFTQFFYSFYKKPVMLGGKVSLSAAAAVTSSDLKGMSIAKTGTGLYTITLEDKYSKLIGINAGIADSTQDLAVVFQSVNLSAKTIVLVTKVAGTAADVSDACDLYLNIVLSNSSVD